MRDLRAFVVYKPSVNGPLHIVFIYKEDTSTHAEGTDPRGGVERASGSQDTIVPCAQRSSPPKAAASASLSFFT